MSPAVVPCPTVSLEINPLLFQTLGKRQAANVGELSALTNVFSLLQFTEVEDRKDMLFSKEPHRLRDLYFADMSAFCLPNMSSCAPVPQITTSSVLANAVNSSFPLEI